MNNDRFKFRIACYERQGAGLPWQFVEYISPDNQHWGLNQCGDILSASQWSAHYNRQTAPDSVCRVYEPEMCTGLKDKNGNLIYEGDVLHKKNDKGYMLVYEVIWSAVECGWAIKSIEGARALNVFDCDEAVIIGNIH